MAWLSDSALNHLREVIEWPDFAGTRYELLEEIARGGMGTVYLARDKQLYRKVALKVLNVFEGSEGATRMAHEARILARLEHPGIVPVHDVGALPDGRVYYAMKRVEGRRLDEYARSKPELPDLLRLFCRITEPVAFAHSHGIIHRDLKPANIMVGTFGEVLVLDWGVAKILDFHGNDIGKPGGQKPDAEPPDAAPGAAVGTESHVDGTAHGMVIGTHDYMAPEQAAGEVGAVDARSDVYALGKVLSFLLEQVLGPGGIPKPLRAIAEKAASRKPAERYATALTMAADVARYLDGTPVTAYRETVLERTARLVSRHRTAVALVLAYLFMRLLIFLLVRR